MNKVAQAFSILLFMFALTTSGILFAAWMLMLAVNEVRDLGAAVPGLPFGSAILLVVFLILTKLVWVLISSLLKGAGESA